MSVKKFIGLGELKTPVSHPKSTGIFGIINKTVGIAANIVVSSATKNVDDKNTLPPTPLPSALTSAGLFRPDDSNFSVSVSQQTEPQSFSHESSIAPFETLFHEFNLETEAVYNFWTEDEEDNESEERGRRNLEDIPRYIRVFWEQAPKILFEEDFSPKPTDVRAIDPVKFGLEIEGGQGFFGGGVAFSPSHLSSDGFSSIKNSLANGFIYPGIISSVVELPAQSVTPNFDVARRANQAVSLDEDAFLLSSDTDGISPHELIANANEVVCGFLDTSWLSSTPISEEVKNIKKDLFDGGFNLERSLDGSNMSVQKVQSDSSAFSLNSSTAVSNQKTLSDSVIEILAGVSEPANISESPETVTNRVKFVNPAIDGILSDDKTSLMTDPHHAESMVVVAAALPNLDILAQSGLHEEISRIDAPSFPSPIGLAPLEYIGYVIEKYKMNDSGIFEKVEEIDLPDREYSEYIDTKVVYGKNYRYRIRTILRWTRISSVDLNGVDQFTDDQFLTQTRPVAPFASSYFGGEWSDRWSYATLIDLISPPPPDEFTARPESARGRVCISLKFPENSQRDIFAINILKKTQNADGKDLTPWSQIGPAFGPQNSLFYDTDVDFFQKNGFRYVYSAQCVSRHWEWSTLSDQVGVRLNFAYKSFGEYPVDFISSAGVNSSYFGAFSTIPIKRTVSETIIPVDEKDSHKSADFSLSGREVFGNGALDDSFYFLRIESLDTGEKIDYALNTTIENVDGVVNELPIFSSVNQSSLLSKNFRNRNSQTSPPRIASDGKTSSIIPTDRT